MDTSRSVSLTSISDGTLTSVKENVAEFLLDEIINGRLKPGERIVEAKWAAKLQVAQASIREALNILAARGFVGKELGRSARVTTLTDEDVAQIYEMRVALESFAARLVATKRPDLSEMDLLLAEMHSAVQYVNLKRYCERGLGFHLMLAEKSGNRFLLNHLKLLIVPLFAFILLRRNAMMDEPARWSASYERHRKILEAIRSEDPDYAEREVAQIIRLFSQHTAELLALERGSQTTVVG